MRDNLVSVGQIARIFGKSRDAPIKWRIRYPSFPQPKATNPYPMYDLDEVIAWYQAKWPNRMALLETRLHHYKVTSGAVMLTTTRLGPLEQAKGFLKAVQSFQYADWRVYSTSLGFSAHRGNEIEVYVLDVTDLDPHPWHYYDTRYRTGGTPK